MADYILYYWSAPFRGQFVRAVLAHAGRDWDEAGDAAISELMAEAVADMPVPFMGPPMLVDRKADVAVSQMSAIVMYLGESLDLLPEAAEGRALSLKTVADANDVIDELTLDGGRQMWTAKRWTEFEPRLRKWMSFWEETGSRHDLTEDAGWLLGGSEPGVADIVSATLWSTIAERFPVIGRMLDDVAPQTAAHAKRLYETSRLAALAAKARGDYGEDWSGGRIEASLRKVLSAS